MRDPERIMPSSPSEPDPGRKTVLIVEDDPGTRRVLASGLTTTLGMFDVLTAEHGQEAVGLLESRPVDVVVTDLAMPIMDGFALIGYLSNRAASPPVVVLSALAPTTVAEGLDGYRGLTVLRKPAGYPEVARAVLEALERQALGQVAGIPLASVLQLVEAERRSCALAVTSGRRRGRLYFESGKLVNAFSEDFGADGEAAAFDILSWEGTAIEFERLPEGVRRTIELSTQALLIEVARRQDAALARRTPVPPSARDVLKRTPVPVHGSVADVVDAAAPGDAPTPSAPAATSDAPPPSEAPSAAATPVPADAPEPDDAPAPADAPAEAAAAHDAPAATEVVDPAPAPAEPSGHPPIALDAVFGADPTRGAPGAAPAAEPRDLDMPAVFDLELPPESAPPTPSLAAPAADAVVLAATAGADAPGGPPPGGAPSPSAPAEPTGPAPAVASVAPAGPAPANPVQAASAPATSAPHADLIAAIERLTRRVLDADAALVAVAEEVAAFRTAQQRYDEATRRQEQRRLAVEEARRDVADLARQILARMDGLFALDDDAVGTPAPGDPRRP